MAKKTAVALKPLTIQAIKNVVSQLPRDYVRLVQAGLVDAQERTLRELGAHHLASTHIALDLIKLHIDNVKYVDAVIEVLKNEVGKD